MEMPYHLACLLHLAIQIQDLMTGHHLIIASNLKSLTSFSVITRCLLGISTLCSAFGLRLLPSTMMNHRFQQLQLCTTLSMLFPLVMLPENLLVCSTMEYNLHMEMFHHGWKLSTTSGSE